MGQENVYQFLKKSKGKWHTSKEIAKALSLSPGSVSISLLRLRRHDNVFYKPNPKRTNSYLYKVK